MTASMSDVRERHVRCSPESCGWAFREFGVDHPCDWAVEHEARVKAEAALAAVLGSDMTIVNGAEPLIAAVDRLMSREGKA